MRIFMAKRSFLITAASVFAATATFAAAAFADGWSRSVASYFTWAR